MEEQGKQQEIEIEEVTAQENVIAVRDLVPMRAAMDDSMERIADMKDQFSQTIDPILRMYNCLLYTSHLFFRRAGRGIIPGVQRIYQPSGIGTEQCSETRAVASPEKGVCI